MTPRTIATAEDMARALHLADGPENEALMLELRLMSNAATLAVKVAGQAKTLSRAGRRSHVASARENLARESGPGSEMARDGIGSGHLQQFRNTFERMLDGCLEANATGEIVVLSCAVKVDGEERKVTVATYTPGGGETA